MQARNYCSVSSGKRAERYVYDIKFLTLELRENEISLRIWSGGTAHLHTLDGT